jgi:hypothetical protein
MILGLVGDCDDRPNCTHMWPGDTADVTAFLPVACCLRQSFCIGRVCVVANRSSISAACVSASTAVCTQYDGGFSPSPKPTGRASTSPSSAISRQPMIASRPPRANCPGLRLPKTRGR